MKKVTILCGLLLAAIIVYLPDSAASAAMAAESPGETDPNAPLFEGALLSPVGAYGDTTQYVVSLDYDTLCGVSQGRLKTFSIDNAENIISSYWLPHRNPEVFAYYKGYVYLPQDRSGIWIFDVSRPEKIRLAGVLDVAVSPYAEIDIRDGRLFLADTLTSSLIVLSLENPEAPEEVSRYPLPEGIGGGVKVSLIEDRIYILCYSGLAIFEATELSNPRLLGKVDIVSPTVWGALIVKAPYAYVYAGHEIRIFDVSLPEAIEQKAAVSATWCSHAVLRGNHFIGFGINGLHIYDIGSPLSLERVRHYSNMMPGDFLVGEYTDYVIDENGRIDPLAGLPYFSGNPSRFGFRADSIVIRDTLAYVLGSDRLWVLDISQPWAPQYVADVRVSQILRQTAFIDADHLYTPSQIIDISQPAEPSVIKTLGGGFNTGVAVKDGYVLVARQQDLDIWDAQIPSEATMIMSISFDERLKKIFVHEDTLYLGFLEGKLRSCTLEEDLSLTTLDEIVLAEPPMGLIMDFCIENDLLYVALNGDGVASVDIRDPNSLQVYARFDTSQFAEEVEVVDALAYVADGSGGIAVIDMAESGLENMIASYPSSDWTRAAAISGRYVYTCEGENGIAIFVSNLLDVK